MSREIHVRFWEGVGVRFPHATRLLRMLPAGDISVLSMRDLLWFTRWWRTPKRSSYKAIGQDRLPLGCAGF